MTPSEFLELMRFITGIMSGTFIKRGLTKNHEDFSPKYMLDLSILILQKILEVLLFENSISDSKSRQSKAKGNSVFYSDTCRN